MYDREHRLIPYSAEEEEGLDIQHCIQIIRRRIVVVIIVFAISFAWFLTHNYRKYKATPLLYQTTFKIRLEPEITKKGRGEIYVIKEKYDLKDFYMFVQNDYILGRVLENIYKDKITNENFYGYITRFRQSIKILPPLNQITPEDDVITVYLTNKNPDAVFKIAEEWINVIKDEKIKRRQRLIEKAITLLEEQIAEVSNDLEKNRTEFADFLSKTEILYEVIKKGEEITPAAIPSKIMDLKNKASSIRNLINKIEKIKSQQSSLEAYKFIIYTRKDIINEGYLKDYEEEQELIENLLLVNTEEHPEVIKAKRDLGVIKRKIANEIDESVRSLEKEYEKLNEEKNRWDFLIQKGIEKEVAAYQRLKSNIEELEGNYKDLKDELNDLKLSYRLSKDIAFSVIEYPTKPYEPYNIEEREKKKTAGIFSSFILAIILGLGSALLLETVDTSVKGVEDIEDIGWVALATIPFWKKVKHKEAQITVLKHPHSIVAEAFHALRVNLKFITVDKNVKVVSIISSLPGEGKTFVAVNLAATFALAGEKTLLIEGDIRKPQLHYYFDLTDVKDSFVGLLEGMSIEPHLSSIDNLWILPAGTLTRRTEKILTQEKIISYVEKWKNEFDWIIFDSAPLQTVGDSVIIIKSSECVVPVVLAAKTLKRIVNRSKHILDNLKVNVIGAVLISTKEFTESRYYYYYEKEK